MKLIEPIRFNRTTSTSRLPAYLARLAAACVLAWLISSMGMEANPHRVGSSDISIWSQSTGGISNGDLRRNPSPNACSPLIENWVFNLHPSRAPHSDPLIQLCQALGPAAPCPIMGVDCAMNGPYGCCCKTRGWKAMGPIDWQAYAQGEYVGHWREPHVPIYRLRVDDQLECIYRITRDVQTDPYRLNVGDVIQVDSFTDPNLNRELVIQPDGTVTLRLLGEVRAAQLTVQELREKLDNLYSKYYKLPSITVTPIKVNTKLDDLRNTVDARAGSGGQGRPAKVTPQGTIDLPGLNNIPAQGLTLDELKQEIDLRYKDQLGIEGIEVTPILTQRAPRYVYIFGEVNTPGRYSMEGPTTLMQAISLAGSWKIGANLREIAIFRRGDDWRLMATVVHMQSTMLFNHQPCPCGEIWLDDSDIVMVPKSPILMVDDLVNLYFTRGLYSVLPFSTFYDFSAGAAVVNP
ncbi:MAG TPA: polysaccharide biosynthesis/export family protein [Pirellulales bacterium]|nr:polysaccharide biosynthesis/export family protein [Pirellulales bacterium]